MKSADVRLALQILSLVKVPPRLEPELQLVISGLLGSAALPLRTGLLPDAREALVRVSVLLDVVGESRQSREARAAQTHVLLRLQDGKPVDLMDAYLALGGVVEQRKEPAPKAAPPAPAAAAPVSGAALSAEAAQPGYRAPELREHAEPLKVRFGFGAERERLVKEECDRRVQRDYERHLAAHRDRSHHHHHESLPTWEDLTPSERLHFAALAGSTYWQVRDSMDAHRSAMEVCTKAKAAVGTYGTGQGPLCTCGTGAYSHAEGCPAKGKPEAAPAEPAAEPTADRAAALRMLDRMRAEADLLRPHGLVDIYRRDLDVREGLSGYVAGRETYEAAAARTIRALVMSKMGYADCATRLMDNAQPAADVAP